MCGIFGFVLKKPLPMNKVFSVLQKLEVSQYLQEPRPVGGYGAGVALLLSDGSVMFEKVGKGDGSPVANLAEIVRSKVAEASVLIGHVRMPSPEFMDTARFRETAQPYVGQFESELIVASVHNGKVENYKELKERLGEHIFESEKFGLVDSEVIPHYFVEILNETEDVDEAVYELFCALKGSNAVAMLHLDEDSMFLHLLHRGKTRGLTVWTNVKNEVIFCSRKEPVMEEFGRIFVQFGFSERISIACREDVGFKLSFPLVF